MTRELLREGSVMLRLLLFVLAVSSAVVLVGTATARAVAIESGDLLALKTSTQLVVIKPSGAVEAVPADMVEASSAIAAGGRLYVGDMFGPFASSPGVYQIDPDTGVHTLVTPGVRAGDRISLAAGLDGAVYASHPGDGLSLGWVRRIDASGTVTTLPTLAFAIDYGIGPSSASLTMPYELATSAAGDLFALGYFQIYSRGNLLGLERGIARFAGPSGPAALVTVGGGLLGTLVGGGIPGYSPVNQPGSSLAVGPDGKLYLSVGQSPQAGIYRIDPLTGAQTLWLPGVKGELASDGTRLLLADANGISAIDLASGVLTPLFSGAMSQNLLSIEVVPEPSTAALVLAGITMLAARRPRSSR